MKGAPQCQASSMFRTITVVSLDGAKTPLGSIESIHRQWLALGLGCEGKG